MTVMNHDSYWHGYLMARHHTFLIIGIVVMVMTLIFTLTGECFGRFGVYVSRAEDPKEFWQAVGTYFVIGLVCFGLYLYTLT